MTNTIQTALITAVAGTVAFALLFLVMPVYTHAATYAYVDTQGEVKTVSANDWMTAIATAINIHTNSGVLLLDSQADTEVVGEQVGSTR